MSNRGPIEYTSIPAPAAFTPPILWIQIVSAGSGGLVVKDESNTAQTYTGLAAGDVIAGPFREITSMTCSKIRAGDSLPVPSSTLANVAPASSGALGSVEMSVAPANAATPIAVGTNDKRVTAKEATLTLNQTDGSLAESPVWKPGVACTVTGVYLISPSAITQSDTNYLTLTAVNNDGAGTPVGNIASATTKTTGGLAFTALQEVSLGAVTNASLTASSVVSFKSVKTSSGQAVTGNAILRITYSVP